MVQPVNGVTLICAWEPCKQPFTVFPSQVKKAKYCSRPCQWLATAAGRVTKVTLICANPQCQKPFQVHANTMQRGSTVRCCSRKCKAGYAESRIDVPAFAAEFWSQVAVGEPDVCWPWQGRDDGKGYGRVYVPGTQVDTGTHIVAFYLTHGRWPAPGLNVCHSCDNPPCCNGRHLWEGTTLQNVQDSVSKGRKPSGDRHHSRLHPERVARGDRSGMRLHPESVLHGEQHPSHKITDAQVEEARALHATGISLATLGKRYGISARGLSYRLFGREKGSSPHPAIRPRMHP